MPPLPSPVPPTPPDPPRSAGCCSGMGPPCPAPPQQLSPALGEPRRRSLEPGAGSPRAPAQLEISWRALEAMPSCARAKPAARAHSLLPRLRCGTPLRHPSCRASSSVAELLRPQPGAGSGLSRRDEPPGWGAPGATSAPLLGGWGSAGRRLALVGHCLGGKLYCQRLRQAPAY